MPEANDSRVWREELGWCVEVSGNEFVARQTEQIKREFGRSRPRPRNRVMGFHFIDGMFRRAERIRREQL